MVTFLELQKVYKKQSILTVQNIMGGTNISN